MKKDDLISIREIRPSDKTFLIDSWSRSLRSENNWFKSIDKDAYKAVYPAIIEALINNSHVRIACLKEDEDTIIGYSVSQPPVLHWTFVRQQWRKIGLMNDLVPEGITTSSHLTNLGRLILRKRKWKFNPFI